jgi:anti-anti-sigma regulatory factor
MRVDAPGSMLRVGRTASGFLVQVEGRGLCGDSPALHEFAVQSLDDQRGSNTLIVDLSHCDYLDSTFLGCLVGLHQKYNRTSPHRFTVGASYDKSKRLFGPTRLNLLLDVTETFPEQIDNLVELSRPILTTVDLGQHVMECHRRLAELGGARAQSFKSVADQLALELQETSGAGKPATVRFANPAQQVKE